MRIFFYPPFKPLGHSQPSGDLTTAQGLHDFLLRRGHQVFIASDLRTRWIYRQPWRWPQVLIELGRAKRKAVRYKPDLWLTFHAYYKAPDLLGPAAAGRGLPYVIFQGMFSTKVRRDIATIPGYILNRRALLAAGHVFNNRLEDLEELARLLPRSKLTYVPPGIRPEEFQFAPAAREEWRRQWEVGDAPVVLSAAMFRSDVKTQGLVWLIRVCGSLLRQGFLFYLVIVGEGPEEGRLRRLAALEMGDRAKLTGKIPREKMYRLYSAGDVFAFPGFRESLGMVYLEAQSCGLPVVACRNGGIPEVVRDGETGLLVPLNDFDSYARALRLLLENPDQRRKMGAAAAEYVRAGHDLDRNYLGLETVIENLVSRNRKDRRP